MIKFCNTGSIWLLGWLLLADATAGQALPQPSFYPSDDEVRSRLERILSSPEYRRLRPDTSKDVDQESVLLGWLRRLMEWLSGDGKSTHEVPLLDLSFVRFGLYVLAFLGLAVVVFVIGRSLLRSRRRLTVAEISTQEGGALLLSTGPPGELAADVYVGNARELAAIAEYKQAIRQLLLGAMSWIERRGMIRYRRGLTNRDYVRAVRRHRDRSQSLSGIIEAFERVYFGRRQATASSYEDCLRFYQEGFDDAEAGSPLAG
jgi:hypothetical protein